MYTFLRINLLFFFFKTLKGLTTFYFETKVFLQIFIHVYIFKPQKDIQLLQNITELIKNYDI